MEFVAIDKKALSLSDLLEERSWDVTKAGMRQIAYSLADSIHTIHQKGVLHNDVKGCNIMLSNIQGRWLTILIDFGLASFRNRRPLFNPADDLEGHIRYYPQVARTGDQHLYALSLECYSREPDQRPDMPSVMKMLKSLP